MPRYLCELVDADGRLVEASRQAESEEAAVALFSRGERYLVSVRELPGAEPRRRCLAKPEEIRELTGMLGALLESGLSLKDSLSIAAGAAPPGSGTKRALDALLESVEKGTSLSGALECCGGFPGFYRGMIGIGERIGSVERVLPRLHSWLTERKAMRDKIAGALVYPSLVCALAVLGAACAIVFLLPRLLEIFSQLGGAAAVQARSCASSMSRALYLILAVVVGIPSLVLAISVARRRDEAFAAKVDAFALRLPVAGPFIVACETLGFAYAMEALAGGGLSVEAALGETAGIVGNRAFRAAVLRCREDALKGETLSRAAAKRPELPSRVAQWLAIGERSGQVELVFGQLRRYYQAETERMSSRFMSLIEPAFTVLVGALVLAIVLSFVVPLFSMYGAAL
jgi:type II secretory pathway component PulF